MSCETVRAQKVIACKGSIQRLSTESVTAEQLSTESVAADTVSTKELVVQPGDSLVIRDSEGKVLWELDPDGGPSQEPKITFSGVIDPTAVDFEPVSSNPFGPSNETAIYVKSTDGHLYRGSKDLEAGGSGGDSIATFVPVETYRVRDTTYQVNGSVPALPQFSSNIVIPNATINSAYIKILPTLTSSQAPNIFTYWGLKGPVVRVTTVAAEGTRFFGINELIGGSFVSNEFAPDGVTSLNYNNSYGATQASLGGFLIGSYGATQNVVGVTIGRTIRVWVESIVLTPSGPDTIITFNYGQASNVTLGIGTVDFDIYKID